MSTLLPHSPLLTVSEVAEYLRVSEMTVYRLLSARELAATKVGRRYRVHLDDLLAYVEGARVPVAS